MRIDRFGSPYAAAYQFSHVRMRDRWGSGRPPIIRRASGAAGAFDFYGSNNYPVSAFTVRKQFSISASSEADIELELFKLRNATIAADRDKLWAMERGGNARGPFWCYAKCTELNAAADYREHGQWLKDVRIEFVCPEGVWYVSEAYSSCQWTVAMAGTTNLEIPASGNVSTGVRLEFQPNGGTLTAIEVEDQSTVGWTFSESVAAGNKLIVDADLYIVTNNAVNSYSALSVSASNTLWVELAQNYGTAVGLDACGLTGTATNVTACAFYWDTYVL